MPSDSSLPSVHHWASLLAKAQEGDSKAYELFLKEVYPYIRGIVGRKIGGLVDVDDITQDCILALHNHLNTYSPKRPAKPWVVAIAKNKICDHFRRLSRRKEDFGEDEKKLVTTTLVERTTGEEEAQASLLAEGLKALPPDLAFAVKETKLEGKPYKEVADHLKISEPALRKRLSRAYKALAQWMNKQQDQDFAY